MNTSECGEYHNLKWYKDDVRVGVYSPTKDWYRLEDDLLGVEAVRVEASEVEVSLSWEVRGVGEEGRYKCEITYLAPRACPVVRLISRLVVISLPTSLNLYSSQLGTRAELLVTNSTVGPVSEGTEVSLRCVSSGVRSPRWRLSWYLGDSLLPAHTELSDVSVSSTLHLNMTRSLLNKRVRCEVATLASEIRPMTASVEIDLNLEPTSTMITPELDRERLISGDTIRLVCQTEGARPAANIEWHNETDGSRVTSHHQIATLQSDGTYMTLSKLVVEARPWHHGNTLTCASGQTTRQAYTLRVLYPPVLHIRSAEIIANEGTNVSIVCEYHSNPPQLLNIQVSRNWNQPDGSRWDFFVLVIIRCTKTTVRGWSLWRTRARPWW